MAKSRKKPTETRTVENRRARHDYTISDTLEVGMVLAGSEVKSVRDGQVSIAEGYVTVREEPPSIQVHGLNIGLYQPAGNLQHHPTRVRKLLAHKKEIRRLAREVQQKGVTIVPLKLYFKNGYAKLLIGVAMGKQRGDKRQSIKEREMRRDMERAMARKVLR